MCEFFRPEIDFDHPTPPVKDWVMNEQDLSMPYETDSRGLIIPYFAEVDEEIQVTQETPLKVLGNIMINGTLVTEQDVIYALEKIGIDPIKFQSAFADFLGVLEEKMR
jgi:hypothetical protein